MRRSSLPALAVCLLFLAPSVGAQEVAPLPSAPVLLPLPAEALTADQRRELDDWVAAIRKWQRMDKHWHNEPAHNAFGQIVEREPRPAAPQWLDARCAAVAAASTAAPLGPACRMLASLEEDPTVTAMRTASDRKRLDAEKPAKSTFLTRVHIDGLWTSTSSDLRFYGLVGSHISLVDVGRVQFFGPPGVILLSMPDQSGVRHLRPGYTWGMSIRLSDVRLFAPSKNMTLFLTISKVWVPGGSALDRLQGGGFDIAGFSLAPRRHTE
jgi:hypothetical protein